MPLVSSKGPESAGGQHGTVTFVLKFFDGIVSMWSLLENVASVILETGYLTKGKEEQNITMFYFKTR